jgi:hypothetical protein
MRVDLLGLDFADVFLLKFYVLSSNIMRSDDFQTQIHDL